MNHRTIFITVSFFVLSVTGSALSSILKDPFLGISPEDEKYYKSSDVLKCKDGSKKFTRAQLNDDFCDCPDGTDEPGTSACPAGKFYCRNVGHSPIVLFSSKVNDGICDCCDGSDEYDGKVKCPNTCWEAGKVARDRLEKKIATYQEGVAIRKQEIQNAKIAIAKDEEELAKLKNEEKVLKGLVQKLKEHKEEIEKAEEKERLQKEKEERERKETEEEANKERSKIEEEGIRPEKKEGEPGEPGDNKPAEPIHDEIGLVDEPATEQDFIEDAKEEHEDFSSEFQHSDGGADKAEAVHNVGQHEESEHKSPVVTETKEHSVASDAVLEDGDKDASIHEKSSEASDSTEGLSKEELGRLVASRWTGEKVEKESEQVSSEDHHQENHEHEELPGYNNDGDDDGYASETDEDNHKYVYDDGEDESHEDISEENHDDSAYKSVSDDESDFSDMSIEDNPSWFEKIQQTVRNLIRSVNFFKTPIDKSEAAQICKDYEESSSKLSKIQSRISSLSQKLKHDFGPDKEFYSFYGQCFEGKENKYVYKVCPFKQATQQEGYSTTRLGSWDKFEDYRAMIFSNGDKCWNGPDRSMKVKLRCGLRNEVTDVDEPSRCEYVAVLSTPALCLEQKLKELQDKLEAMNKDRPQGHDEL